MENKVQSIAFKETSSVVVIAILSALMAMTSLSVDIYLPAMPTMQHDLQGNIELTISGFLIGFSIAQIFWVQLVINTEERDHCILVWLYLLWVLWAVPCHKLCLK